MYSCTQRAPAKWLCSIGRMVIPQHTETFSTLEACKFRETHPSRSDLRVTLRLRRSDALPARILYWAAAPRDLHASRQGSSAECAYDKYTNMGVVCRKHGKYCIDLRCPQPYVAEDPETGMSVMWSRHMHFVAVRENDTVDTDTNKVHTLLIMPGEHNDKNPLFDYTCTPLFDPRTRALPSLFVGFYDYMRARQKGVVCINAVDHPDYRPICTSDLVVTPTQERSTIEGTVVEAVHKMVTKHSVPTLHALKLCASSSTPSKKRSALRKSAKKHASKVTTGKRRKDATTGGTHTTLSTEQIAMLKRWPLLVYCVKPECHAASTLLFVLDSLGFHNVYYMPHGINEARRQLNDLHASHVPT